MHAGSGHAGRRLQPHGVFNTDSIPEEWKQYKLPPAESAAAASTNLAEE